MKPERTKLSSSSVEAGIGYAAGAGGEAVAYARVTNPDGEHLLRIPFRVGGASALQPREAGYAALTAVARALRGWGIRRVRFRLEDAGLIDDLVAHRDLPAPMVLPYVRLRCALNQLDDFRLEFAAQSDLAQRAHAEVVLNVAA